MRPEEPPDTGRMYVSGRVGVAMMTSMVTGPPEWSSLSRRGPKYRHDELKRSGGLERPMAEISVIAACQSKHAGQQCRETHERGDGADPAP